MKKIIASYLQSLTFKKPPTTQRTYTQGIKTYIKAVGLNAPVDLQIYIKFLRYLAPYPAGTQHVYRAAVMDFYSFYCDECGGNINLLAMKRADKRYLKRVSKIVNFDRQSVSALVEYAVNLKGVNLPMLRDKAFILLLVDSGLRISEACNLKRGDVPWNDKFLYITGKGGKEAKVHFSQRALDALKRYLDKRMQMDGKSGELLESLPLFARHDRGAGKKVKPIHAGGMWNAFAGHMEKAGLKERSISPHKMRHEAITHFYEETRDIRQTMEFSRHARLDTVSRYTHLADHAVDDEYDRIFNKK